MIRKTISTSFVTVRENGQWKKDPNPKLAEYGARLSWPDWVQLKRRIHAGARVVIFHIDGDRVSLASEQITSELAIA